MKAVFISYYQVFHEELVQLLDELEIRGYTHWDAVMGRGSRDGEPHLGTHAWPALNGAILTVLPEEKLAPLLKKLHELDNAAPMQGLRAFTWDAQEG